MSPIALALRRLSRSASSLVMLAVCALAVFLASFPSASEERPPAGVCDLDGSAESRRIAAHLMENGFELFYDEDEMYGLVADGALDCAVVLPDGLSGMISGGELDGALRFITSPLSYAPDLYKNHAAAALFSEAAPYIAAELIPGVPESEVLASYRGLLDGGRAFAFDVVTADGEAASGDGGSGPLAVFAAAVLMFVTLAGSAGEVFTGGFRELALRLGLARAVHTVLLPGLAVRALSCALAVCAGLLAAYLCGCGEGCLALLPAVLVYAALLPSVGLLLAAVLPGTRQLQLLIPAVVLASPALCPVFVDVSLVVPAASSARVFLPTWWLWLVAEKPLAWLAAAVAALPVSLAAACLRYSISGKYRLK